MDVEISGSDPLTPAMVETITAACVQAERDGVLVVHLRSGAQPVLPWPGDVNMHLVTRWERELRKLERVPAVTIAVAGRDCRGLAAEVLLACDYRVAETGFEFRLPAASAESWPGMSLYRMATQIGVARARRLALFDSPASADDALAWGLVDEIVPAEELESRAAAVIDDVAGLRGKELAVRRRLVFDAVTMGFEDALGSHLAACDRALRLAG